MKVNFVDIILGSFKNQIGTFLSQNLTKILIFGGIGLILLIIIVYVLYKINSSRFDF